MKWLEPSYVFAAVKRPPRRTIAARLEPVRTLVLLYLNGPCIVILEACIDRYV